MGNIPERVEYKHPMITVSSKDLPLIDGFLKAEIAEELASRRDRYELATFVADFDWLARLSPRVSRRSQHSEFLAYAHHATLLLKFADTDVLVDPGEGIIIEDANPSVIGVTHAHQDHVGGLIEAAKRYKDASILMTPETFDLLQLLPGNAASQIARIMQERGHLVRADGNPHRVFDVEYRFLPAGHLVGAAMIDIARSDQRVLITGDFALRELGGLPGAVWTSTPYDVVLMESSHEGV